MKDDKFLSISKQKLMKAAILVGFNHSCLTAWLAKMYLLWYTLNKRSFMYKNQEKLEVVFFKTDKGSEPVREWLIGLKKEDKKSIGEDVKTVQFGWPLGMPLVKNLGQGLWEIRTNLSDKRISRIIFFMDKSSMVLVNGFIKKSRKTPKEELDLSKKEKVNIR